MTQAVDLHSGISDSAVLVVPIVYPFRINRPKMI